MTPQKGSSIKENKNTVKYAISNLTQKTNPFWRHCRPTLDHHGVIPPQPWCCYPQVPISGSVQCWAANNTHKSYSLSTTLGIVPIQMDKHMYWTTTAGLWLWPCNGRVVNFVIAPWRQLAVSDRLGASLCFLDCDVSALCGWERMQTAASIVVHPPRFNQARSQLRGERIFSKEQILGSWW